MPAISTATPAIRQALALSADESGFIELPKFIEIALYHPTEGYYRKPRLRVGKNAETDFYTASSFQNAFAALAVEAACGLLEQAGLDPSCCRWVEIGAEPGRLLLDGQSSPFRESSALGLDDATELQGDLIVFSNELFDAQPFRQVRFESGEWREYGIQLSDNRLEWRRRAEPCREARSWISRLPAVATEGYTIDLSTGADALANRLAAQSWRGAFIAFDYGKTLAALVRDTPNGTARAYSRHRQIEDILLDPGQQDITHHVCWDSLESILGQAGFTQMSLQSQEAFIATRAQKLLQRAFDPGRDPFDPLRGQLKQLMHPTLMGHKFQVLSAIRPLHKPSASK